MPPRAGNLYGTTEFGGASGQGVVFKLSPGGTETVLYSFTGGNDGAFPNDIGSLIADRAGNLYGTTVNGGADPGNGVSAAWDQSPLMAFNLWWGASERTCELRFESKKIKTR